MKKAFLLLSLVLCAFLLTAFPANAGFTLQLASFRDMQDARRYLSNLQIESQQAFIHTQQTQQEGGTVWYKVRVGPFENRSFALNYKERMVEKGHQTDILLVQALPGATQEPSLPEPTLPEPTLPEPSEPPELVEKASDNPDSEGISSQDIGAEERSVTLNWEPSIEPGIGGYRIYYDTQPGPPYNPAEEDWVEQGPSPISVDKDVSQITLHGLRNGKSYYFSITAYDELSGVESGFSQEVIARPVPPDPSPDDGLVPQIPLPELVEEVPVPQPSPAVAERPEEIRPSRPTVETPSDQADGLARIEPGDVLDIEVPGQREMTQRYDVDPDGNIYMLMVGRVPVGGRTPLEMEERLRDRLSRYLMREDRVKVLLAERRRYIEITGGVRYPGWYRVPYLSTVRELVDLAGGPLEHAGYAQVLLRRMKADGLQERVVHGQIQLYPDDELFVPYPEVYQVLVDRGDVLFVSVPMREPPTRRPDTRDSADLRDAMARNRIVVDRNGYLYVPDIGHFYVNGLTTEEIKKVITDRLPRYLAGMDPVTVSLIEKSHYINISGHVENPGWYNIPELANAQAALNEAGGAVDGAVMSDVYIIRRQEGEVRRVQVNMYQYSVTGDPRLLTPLHEEDTLFVPISPAFGNIKRTLRSWDPPPERLEKETESKVRIFGAVNNPGIYEPTEDMDLLDIMVLAGGENQYADLSKIVIIRDNKLEVVFNLHQFLEGKGVGPSLRIPSIQHGDTVYVRHVEWTTMEPKEDKVWYITGKVRGPGQYKLWDRMTVLQAIALAGGLDEWADARRITIVRMVDGKQENIPYNYYRGVAGKYPELNIYLMANDTIVVP